MVDDTPLIDGGNANIGRRGRIRLCCDSKRGVVVVNAVGILLTAIAMISLRVGHDNPDIEADAAGAEIEEWINKYYEPTMIVNGIAIAVNLLVMFGASIYSASLVALGAAYIVGRAAYALVVDSLMPSDVQDLGWAYVVWPMPIIWAMVMLFWHGLFIFDVRRGIMSPHTYPTEGYSCCCGV